MTRNSAISSLEFDQKLCDGGIQIMIEFDLKLCAIYAEFWPEIVLHFCQELD